MSIPDMKFRISPLNSKYEIFSFTRITGVLITFAFGTIFLTLYTRNRMNADINEKISHSNKIIFATLKRAQTISVFGRSYYFYSYSGMWKNKEFDTHEEMKSDLFNVLSEGKNIQLHVYEDSFGIINTKITANNTSNGKSLNLPQKLSMIVALFGILLIILSFIIASRKT